jgi:D-hexose-6-phosphate mutarotase
MPAHGFARTSAFSVIRSFKNKDAGTGIELALENSADSRRYWPGEFELRLVITMGMSLDVALTMHNRSDAEATYTAALHSYIQVGAVSDVQVHGLSKTEYLDKVEDFARKREVATPTIKGETDRVFLETASDCVVDDPVLARRVRIAKRGSNTTVLWNPGPAKAREMADFDDEGYRSMLCIESANAFDDAVTLAPGASHTLATTISVEHK